MEQANVNAQALLQGQRAATLIQVQETVVAMQALEAGSDEHVAAMAALENLQADLTILNNTIAGINAAAAAALEEQGDPPAAGEQGQGIVPEQHGQVGHVQRPGRIPSEAMPRFAADDAEADAESFLLQIEEVFEAYHTPEAQRAVTFKTALDPVTAHWLRTAHQQATYEELVVAFRGRFTGVKFELVRQAEYERLPHRGTGESVDAFNMRFCRAAQRAHCNLVDRSQFNKYLLLLDAETSNEIRRVHRMQPFQSTIAAMDEASSFDAFVLAQMQARPTKRPTGAPVQPKTGGGTCKIHGPGHADKDCRVQRQAAALQKQDTPKPAPTTGQTIRRCFTCGDPGHVQRNCPSIKKEDAIPALAVVLEQGLDDDYWPDENDDDSESDPALMMISVAIDDTANDCAIEQNKLIDELDLCMTPVTDYELPIYYHDEQLVDDDHDQELLKMVDEASKQLLREANQDATPQAAMPTSSPSGVEEPAAIYDVRGLSPTMERTGLVTESKTPISSVDSSTDDECREESKTPHTRRAAEPLLKVASPSILEHPLISNRHDLPEGIEVPYGTPNAITIGVIEREEISDGKHRRKADRKLIAPHRLLRARVQVEGKTLNGIIDCGSEVVVLTPTAAEALGVEDTGRPCPPVRLGDNQEPQRPTFVGREVTIKYGKRSSTVSPVVMTLPHKAEILLGLPCLADIGVTVTGLLPPHLEILEESEFDDARSDWMSILKDHAERVKADTIDEVAFDLATEWPEIQELLNKNAALPEGNLVKLDYAEIIIPTTKPEGIYVKPYPVALKYESLVTKQVAQWRDTGIIQRRITPSPFNFPLLAVLQRNKVRTATDFRALNVTIPGAIDRQEIPRIHDVLRAIGSDTYFVSLDLKAGYTQLPVHPDHRHRLAFHWQGVQYNFVGCPFGLSWITSRFQRIMTTLLADIEGVEIYVDDVCIHAPSMELLRDRTRAVMERLNGAPFKLNLEKCEFGVRNAHLLGHRVGLGGLRPDERLVQSIIDAPVPVEAEQVTSWISLVNYFRHLLPNLAEVARPLDVLRQQRGSITLSDDQLQAFRKVKELIQSAPPIVAFDANYPLVLAVDASNTAIGYVLMNDNPDDDTPRPIKFGSRALTKTEMNWSVTRKELLAIVWAVIQCDYYLQGTHFNVLSDHRSLSYAFQARHYNQQVYRAIVTLADYNFDITFIPGEHNRIADALSRLYGSSSNRFPTDGLDMTIATVTTSTTGPSGYMRNRSADEMIVPDVAMRTALLDELHGKLHMAAKAMVATIRDRGYAWDGMTSDAAERVRSCLVCAMHQIAREGFHPSTSIDAAFPGEHFAMDLLTPLPMSSDGFNTCLVVVDIATRFCFLRPLSGKSAKLVQTELERIFADFAPPARISSDSGGEFYSLDLAQFFDKHGTRRIRSTPYHKEGNSVAERMIRTIQAPLKRAMSDNKDWATLLPEVQLATNLRPSRRTGSAPFTLFFARPAPRVDRFMAEPMSGQMLQERIEFNEAAIQPGTRLAIDLYNAAQEAATDEAHWIPTEQLAVGDKVMVNDSRLLSKWRARRHGPFRIARTTGKSYVLEDRNGNNLIKRYTRGQLIKTAVAMPPASEDPDVYTVDAIIDHRKGAAPDSFEYLTTWEGYPAAEATWTPANDFGEGDAIKNYWARV